MKFALYTLSCLLFTFSAIAQESTSNIWKQNTLTGDWGGGRIWLKEKGITIKPRVSLFEQGMVSGKGDESWAFGGKTGLQLLIDGEKLGLWKGLSIVSHVEYNFGKTANNRAGTLLPQNTALLFPGLDGSDAFDISSLFLSQKIGTNKTLMLGKINMIDIASGTTFMGGAGVGNFQNIAFVAPPTGLVPPYIFGALFLKKGKTFNYTLGAYDPVSVVNKSGFEKPFKEGITFYGSMEKPVTIAGKKGAHSIKAIYSTQNGTDLYDLGDLNIPGSFADIKHDRYYIGYSFNQYLVQDTEDASKGWGVFGQIGFSDGNPTPINWSFLLGVGGASPFKNRSQDAWGIGYFHYSVSNGIKSSTDEVLKLNDENGLEAYYNYMVTPWMGLSIDYQMINPTTANNSITHFIGFRSDIKL